MSQKPALFLNNSKEKPAIISAANLGYDKSRDYDCQNYKDQDLTEVSSTMAALSITVFFGNILIVVIHWAFRTLA